MDLHEENEARIRALETETGGELDNAFDALKILVMLEHVTRHLGIGYEANEDFEERRGIMLDKIEAKMAEMKEARERAQRQQVITGGRFNAGR